jgi:hypothetical protein
MISTLGIVGAIGVAHGIAVAGDSGGAKRATRNTVEERRCCS